MTPQAAAERIMWEKSIKDVSEFQSDADVNEKYKAGERRLVTESNREKIPNFVEALDKPGYMQVRPFYQRRARWDEERQSRLIESFIMNIPVPPLFLYEKDFNKYEVMDGQQRITSLKAFYSGEFKLKGLQIWKELNGKTYSQLPSLVRSGLDRRSISYIIVLRESTGDEEDAMFLRQTVFERLNTGGVKLEHQEIRNSLFQGPFNDLLVSLAKVDDFRDAWDLPRFTEGEDEDPSAKIKEAAMYQKMDDTEIVLRFFALRHSEHYVRGMHGFLDLYMARARSFTSDDIEVLRTLFLETIGLAKAIYGDHLFRVYSVEQNRWDSRSHKAFSDAVMVGLASVLGHAGTLIDRRAAVIEATKNLFLENEQGTFTGRGNSKKDVQERIEKYETMINKFI